MTNLKPGDILIFEAGDNWLSKCIAKLTDSNVSHAAMCYQDGTMVEMSSSGMVCSKCKEAEKGDNAYLLRLNPEQDAAPLLAAAKEYLDETVYYDYPDLVFFAGLIIYRAIRSTPRWQKIMDYILELACSELDKMLNKLIHKDGKKAMVCSQLVYQIYLDCGDAYKIRIHDGLLQSGDMMQSAPETGTEYICLAELAEKRSGTTSAENTAAADSFASAGLEEPDKEPNMEAVFRELYDALEESGQEDCELCTSNDLNTLVDKTKKFLDKMEALLERAGVELPVRALFVAPSDLLKAENLDNKGTIQITRN